MAAVPCLLGLCFMYVLCYFSPGFSLCVLCFANSVLQDSEHILENHENVGRGRHMKKEDYRFHPRAARKALPGSYMVDGLYYTVNRMSLAKYLKTIMLPCSLEWNHGKYQPGFS